MADNVPFTISGGTYTAASDKVTYSGDANVDVQLVRLVGVTGAEGSKTVQEVLGTAGSAGAAVLTVQGVASMTPLLSSQSGTWNVRAQDGAGTALTSTTRGAKQALSIEVLDASGNQVTTFGGTPSTVSTSHLVTAATTNATSVKASAGTLYGVNGFNNAAYPVYVKFHNTAGTPTAGSGVVFAVGAQAGQPFNFPVPQGGRSFATGIGITVVKDLADAGATAVAASDAVIEVFYA